MHNREPPWGACAWHGAPLVMARQCDVAVAVRCPRCQACITFPLRGRTTPARGRIRNANFLRVCAHGVLNLAEPPEPHATGKQIARAVAAAVGACRCAGLGRGAGVPLWFRRQCVGPRKSEGGAINIGRGRPGISIFVHGAVPQCGSEQGGGLLLQCLGGARGRRRLLRRFA